MRDDRNRSDRLTDEEVADQILLFFADGHDTTASTSPASTLACLFVEFDRCPQWQTILQDEVRPMLDGPLPTCAGLPWTERSAKQCGCNPAAHTIGRSPRNDETSGAYLLAATTSAPVDATD